MRYTLSLLIAAFCSATCFNTSAQVKAYDYATPSYVQFSSPRYEVTENQTNAVITLVRTGDYRNLAAVEYTTRDGTATDSVDFQACGGKVVFPAGQSVRTITIPILRGADVAAKSFQVEMSQADATTVVVTPTAEVEIKAQAPALTIGFASGALQISWPETTVAYALEANVEGEWLAVEGSTLADGTWQAALAPTSAIALFRLRAPEQAAE